MTTFQKAVDKAIAAENAAFLADPQAQQQARAEGDRQRRLMIRDHGMDFLAIPGDLEAIERGEL